MYYVDLYKDIYILIEFVKFFPLKDANFSSFGFQIFFLLFAGVSLPMLINFFAIVNTSIWKESRLTKFGVVIVLPIAPAITIYNCSKIDLMRERTITLYRSRIQTKDRETSRKQLTEYDILFHQWSHLLALLRSNENATEHLLQTLVLIVLIALKYIKSNTVNGFQELIAGGDDLFLLLLSTAWSMVSIILGSLQKLQVQKNHYLPATGKIIYFLFAAVSMICRISAIVVYFAPALGLFNLLMHWTMGKLQFKEIVSEKTFLQMEKNSTLISVGNGWKMIKSYDKMTMLQLDVYYIGFLFLIASHFILATIIKALYAREFRTENNPWKKCFHTLHQGKHKIVFVVYN
jgi:hypothetical protein